MVERPAKPDGESKHNAPDPAPTAGRSAVGGDPLRWMLRNRERAVALLWRHLNDHDAEVQQKALDHIEGLVGMHGAESVTRQIEIEPIDTPTLLEFVDMRLAEAASCLLLIADRKERADAA